MGPERVENALEGPLGGLKAALESKGAHPPGLLRGGDPEEEHEGVCRERGPDSAPGCLRATRGKTPRRG